MRDKRRARRKRHKGYGDHAMTVWADWTRNRQELGWPQESSEVRAFYAAQTASAGAQRDNSVRQGVGIPQCKETPPRRSGSVPRIDRAILGPKVNRHLLDMDEDGMYRHASVLRASFLHPQEPVVGLCMNLGIVLKDGRPSVRTWHRLKRKGLARLEERLSMEPRR